MRAVKNGDDQDPAFEPAAFKAKTVRKFRSEMDKIFESVDIQTENDFQKEGKEVLSQLLKEYEMKAKVIGADKNELEVALNKEFGRYTEKHNYKLGNLNKECDRLAASRCRNYELELEKQFESCNLADEISMSCANAVEQACKTYPAAISNFQLRNRFRRQVREGMERLEENLTNKMNAKRMEHRKSCEKRKADCKRFAQMMMERKIKEKFWQGAEITACKHDILKATTDNWDSQSRGSTEPEEIREDYKKSMIGDVKKLLANFEKLNLSKKSDAAKDMGQDIQKMRDSYNAIMDEKMGGISHEEEEIKTFHEECDKELRSRLLKDCPSSYLEQATLKQWVRESTYALNKSMKVNADFRKNDSEECAKVKQDCVLFAESLSIEELGQNFYEGEELEEKLRKIKRKAFDKFHSSSPTCALSISRQSKEHLEEYLKKDFVNLVCHRNQINKKFVMENVNTLELEMKKKCKMLFKEMLRDGSTASERLTLVRGAIKNKLEDLIDQKANTSTVIKMCRERIDPILEDEHQLLLLSKENEKHQRVDAENALKSRCLNAYKQTMDKLLEETDNVEQSDRQAQNKVAAILNYEDSKLRVAVKEEVARRIRAERNEYVKKESLRKEKAVENQRRLVEHFQKSLQNKIGDVACSPRRLQVCEQQALAEVEDCRKKLRADFQMSTAVKLQSEIARARQHNALRNAIFDHECEQRVEPAIEEFKDFARRSLDHFAQDSSAFERAKEMHVQRFGQNLRGNPEIVEEYRSKFRQALSGLCIRSADVPCARVTTVRQIFIIRK